MKIRRFFGKDMRSALKQVKDELGGDAVIMSNTKTAEGVELVAAIDPSSLTKSEKASANSSVSTSSIKQPRKAGTKAGKNTPSLREIIGDSGPDSLQALLEQQMQQNTDASSAGKQTSAASTTSNTASISAVPEPRADDRIFRSPAFADDIESLNSKQASDHQAASLVPPPSVLEPEQLDTIKAELESIKNVLKFQVSELSEERNKRNKPVHHFLHEQLRSMGLSQTLCNQFIEFLPSNVDQQQGWKYILNLLTNRLQVGGNDILTQNGIVALVGPTGTGKTTTLAKLAAKYAQKYGPEQVALVTIDTYRIAAFEQLATYGKIIGCAVKKAHDSNELNDVLYQLRNKKLVLIDTAGFSQRDSRLIEQLNKFESNLSVAIKKYLVLPAGAQYQVLKQTVNAYRGSNVQGCIFTKLDECYSLGEALSVVIENDMTLSYVTDGQRVPEDIKLADSANLTLIAARLFKKYGQEPTTEFNQPAAAQAHANVGGI